MTESDVRKLGAVNMMHASAVSKLTGVPQERIIAITKYFDRYKGKFPEVFEKEYK